VPAKPVAGVDPSKSIAVKKKLSIIDVVAKEFIALAPVAARKPSRRFLRRAKRSHRRNLSKAPWTT
jgi:hypothetical protein